MKILVFSGGLGNQIFGYAFYRFMKRSFPNQSINGVYNSMWLHEHNGLEIDKYFDVQLPKSSFKAKVCVVLLFIGKKFGFFTHLISMDTRTFTPKAVVSSACKMDLKFIPEERNWIKFKDITLTNRNFIVLRRIKETQSVFIHIRKGDYYSVRHIKRLGGTCPVEYYIDAISYVLSLVYNAVFFVFSDDIDWVRKNLNISKAYFIYWNNGDNSYIDMYLMTQCKYAIIANSTFSYWGAMLGEEKQIITYPKKWVNPPFKAPNIFPDKWIEI
jgi:hypothetical protein